MLVEEYKRKLEAEAAEAAEPESAGDAEPSQSYWPTGKSEASVRPEYSEPSAVLFPAGSPSAAAAKAAAPASDYEA